MNSLIQRLPISLNPSVKAEAPAWSFNRCISAVRTLLSDLRQTWQQAYTALVQSRISTALQQHPCGYCYQPIVCNRWLELLVFQWPRRSESKPHSHQASINFTRVLSGHLIERKYHISGGELRIISERVIYPGQWAWTLPFEIHELLAQDTTAETLHIYIPGRVC